MKPSFALDFRDGVISLLHRTTRGWQQVGSTPADAPDLGEALNYLRSTALGLSPHGLATKLVIPNEQVLYTTVYAPGPEAAKRRRQIKAALEGQTPYKIDELVFDWWGTGPEVRVAVVAKETLSEAEAFAAEHRLNPVSFVGSPDDNAFTGEPFFGASAMSATLLADGEKVERDQEPITIVARDFPRNEPVVAPTETVEPPKPTPAAVDEPVAAPVVEPVVKPEPVVEKAPVAEAEQPKPAPASPPPVNDAAAAAARAKAPAVEEPVSEEAPADKNPLPDFRAAIPPAAGVASFDPKTLAADLVDEAPMALDVGEEPPEPTVRSAKAAPPKSDIAEPTKVTSARITDPTIDDVPPGPAPSIIASFASRRSAGQANDPKSANFAATEASKANKPPVLGPAPLQRPSVARPTLARPAPAQGNVVRETVPFPTKTQTAKPGAAKPGKAGVVAPGIAGPRRERNVVVPLPKSAEAAADGTVPEPIVRTKASVLTGLDGRPLPERGKPRYLGLILTAILLVALALVAAWSTFYLSSNEVDPGATPPTNATAALVPETGTTTADTAVDAVVPSTIVAEADLAASDMPTAEDEALADGQDPSLVTDPAVSDPTAADLAVADVTDPAAALPEPQPAEVVAEAPKPEPAPATALSTDAATVATPRNDPQDEIFLANADTPPQTSDPLVMPQMAANGDPPPDAIAPPPPFGMVYQFDAEGRIIPTPTGIITPEGVMLIAGAPKIVPPERPAALTTEPTTAAAATVEVAPTGDAALGDAAAASTAASTAAELPFPSDPALAGKKPKTRPDGLIDPAATAKQGEALAPDPNSRFASLRPLKRPAAMTRAAEVAPAEDTTAVAASDAASASLAANGINQSASALAVAVSKKPAARPSGMNQAVNAAVAAAVRAPEPNTQVAAVAAAPTAPEADSEPESEAVAPRLPTNASVAKQATDKNALNLSRVALLGIFGTASGRYAMVRQPGGKVKKVVVGDTLDGGRVAAISANAVQYQKGGRMVTLSLPTG